MAEPDARDGDLDRRLLLLAPTRRDAAATCELLARHGIDCLSCDDLAALCREIGRGAGAAMLTEEAVQHDRAGLLGAALRAQPPWSDFPLIVMTPTGDSGRPVPEFGHGGHARLMRRPVHVAVLVSTVRAALRDRERQYARRDDLAEREESLGRWRLALEAGGLASWDLDTRTGRLAWSGRAGDLFGEAPGGAPATLRALLDLIHDDDRVAVAEGIARAIAEVGEHQAEFRVVPPGGAVRWLNARGRAFAGGDGRAVHLVGVGLDVTDRRRDEEALRLNDRRKDEFLAMLAHELRNPLAAITNAVQVARRAGDPGRDDWATGVIADQARHLSRLIEDLLDVSRITRGVVELRRSRVDLAEVVRRAVETCRPLIERRAHRLSVAIDPAPMPVDGDPTRLEQVVVNLLNNAAKYTDRGGHLQVTAGPEAGGYAVAIADDGAGIPPEQLPRMFELFAQGDRSIARSEGGLGIGLTLVDSLVKLHGGSVVARSDGDGAGSVFTVHLPAAPGPVEAAATPAPAVTEPRSGRVLIVDDNLDTARGMAVLLKLAGFEVAVAGDGPAGIDAARDLRPAVILLDIGLPGMDGLEVARRLRREPTGAEVLLIAVSGYGQPEDRRRSREAGFDHHLTKPVQLDDVLGLLGDDDR